jgi:hypothetical protein
MIPIFLNANFFFRRFALSVSTGRGGGVGWECEDYIRLLFFQLFGPVHHRQNWKGWERSGDLRDYQAETCLIITINDTCAQLVPATFP